MVSSEQKMGQVTLVQAYKDFFKGFIDFKGRATRKGYWVPVLTLMAVMLLLLAFVMIQSVLLFTQVTETTVNDVVMTNLTQSPSWFLLVMVGLAVGVTLLSIVPLFSLSVRRFRDVGLTTNGIILFYFLTILAEFSNSQNPVLRFVMLLLSLFGFIASVLPTDYLITKSTNGFLRTIFKVK